MHMICNFLDTRFYYRWGLEKTRRVALEILIVLGYLNFLIALALPFYVVIVHLQPNGGPFGFFFLDFAGESQDVALVKTESQFVVTGNYRRVVI